MRTFKTARRLGWIFATCSLLAVVLLIAADRVDGAGRTVQVGVYENRPKIVTVQMVYETTRTE